MKTIKLITLLILSFSLASFAQEKGRNVGSLSSAGDSETINKKALIVGISDYHAESLKLDYADDDANLFYEYLTNSEAIPEENIALLRNKEATAQNIYSNLKKLINNTEQNDLVYIYFAGHGDVVTTFIEDEGYFLASDANDKREYNGTGGVVSFQHLTKAIDAIVSKDAKVMFVIDACRSGNVINDDGANKTLASLNSSFQNTTKFLSSQSNQLSYESKEIGHGYFTYYLTLGMMGAADSGPADNKLNYFELLGFLNQNINNETSGKQTPVIQASDLFKEYRNVDTEEKNYALNVIQKSSSVKNMFASLGRSVGSEKVTDSLDLRNDPFIQRFNLALKMENYTQGEGSAYSIYKEVLSIDDYPEQLKERMRQTLVNTLATVSQLIVNTYIGGGEILPSAEKFEEAADYMKVSLSIMDPDDFTYDQILVSELFLRGYAVIRSREYSKYPLAKRYLKSALDKEPNAAYLHNALGILYNYEEKFDSAGIHYNKANELIPTWTYPVNNLGTNYLDQRNYRKAEVAFGSTIALDSGYTNPYNNLGVVFERLGNYSSAEFYYRKTLSLNPDNVVSVKNIGNLYESRGNLTKAEEWFRKALNTDSTYVNGYYDLADFLYNNSIDVDEAEMLLRKSIKMSPYYAKGYGELADLYRRGYSDSHKLELADSLYKKAKKLDPFYIWGYAGHGWLYHKKGDTESALNEFNLGIKQIPHSPTPKYNLANYYKNGLGDTDTAIELYENVLSMDSLYFGAYSNLVEIYSNRSNKKVAIQFAEKITKLNPSAPDSWNLLGNLRYQFGEHEKAIAAYKYALKLDTTYAKGLSNLAYSQLQTGDIKSGVNNYKKAHQYNPSKNKLKPFTDYLLLLSGAAERTNEIEKAGFFLKKAFEIDSSNTRVALQLIEFSYMQEEIEEALRYSMDMLKYDMLKADKIKLYKVLVKTAVHKEDKKIAEEFYNELSNIDPRNDFLLRALYFNLLGESDSARQAFQKVNKFRLSDRYLRRNFTNKTIDLISKMQEKYND